MFSGIDSCFSIKSPYLYNMAGRQMVNKVLTVLTQEVLTAEERQLLSFALAPSVSQESLDAFLAGWDIEESPFPSILLLSYLMKTHPDLSFPESVMPRLKGVLTYCRFQNLKLFAHFSQVAAKLDSLQIPAVILKGGAMKVYRPDFPRWMGDIDILVHEQDFHPAAAAMEAMGYRPLKCAHSWDFSLGETEEGAIDLHRYFQMNTGKESSLNEGLFARAREVNVASGKCLLPCREDMVFISLVNLYKNLSGKTSSGSVLNAFIDLNYLLDSPDGFRWDIVWDNASKTGSEIQVRLSAAFVSTLLPQAFPQEFLGDWMDRDEAERPCLELLYQREIISPLRAEIGVTNLIKAFRTVRPILPYIGRRIRLFFLKRVGYSTRVAILKKKGYV